MKPKIGDVIRYGSGSTALMKVTFISVEHGGDNDRFYGEQLFGRPIGAYDYDCKEASEVDLQIWAELRKRYHIDQTD